MEGRQRTAKKVMDDDMRGKQVRTEVPVDRQTISKYSFVNCTVDSAAARKSLFYHKNNYTA